MTEIAGRINLLVGWLVIAIGLLGGFLLGLNFHRDGWLGGYGAFKRRLYRLAHIALIALGMVNILFSLTVRNWTRAGGGIDVASWGFIVGAMTMSPCCIVMAHYPKTRALFLIPVISLVTAAVLTLREAMIR